MLRSFGSSCRSSATDGRLAGEMPRHRVEDRPRRQCGPCVVDMEHIGRAGSVRSEAGYVERHRRDRRGDASGYRGGHGSPMWSLVMPHGPVHVFPPIPGGEQQPGVTASVRALRVIVILHPSAVFSAVTVAIR